MTVYARPDAEGSLMSFQPRYENYIGGEWVAPAAGRYFENASPVNGQPFCEIPRSDETDIEKALDAAHAAAPAWGKTSAAERAVILNKIADRIEENLESIAVAESWDNGKPVRETLNADILVLLSRHPEGLSADHLAMLLDDKDLDVVTIRAEMSRLRRVIGAEYIDSRPYRLLSPIASDVGDVFDALHAADVDRALTRYTGELLPQSVSPGIARLRTELSASVRGAVLSSGNLALLRRWLDLPEGRDDRDCWRVLYNHAAPGSVMRAQARGHLAGLDLDLA